ncbi:MADF domain [Cinara cedri]|uniref:MADF domain n=1 Tax=Cinara cedri TaxID=506608 RepID=A0A5E4M2H7_9HEMI|nr:MADF domain [Cinara cedri]
MLVIAEKYSVSALQTSWKYLKEKYTRKKNAPSGSATSMKKEWPYLRSLKFLDNVVMVQKRTSDSLHSTTNNNTGLLDESPKQKKTLLDVLKSSKPVPPSPSEPEQVNEDYRFCNYMVGIMRNIPRS